jgi:uncharacterized membrane protein YbhN (UPF0104 family)
VHRQRQEYDLLKGENRNGLQRPIKLAIKVAVSVLLILLVMSRIDFTRSLSLLATASVWLIFLGGCLIFVQTALSAAKWRILLSGQGVAVPYRKLLKSYFLANFVNLFTPGFVGGDAYRSVSVSAYTGGVSRSLSSVLVDRITGVVALIMLGAAGLSLYFEPAHPWALGSSIFAVLALGYGSFVLLGPTINRLIAGRTGRVFAFVHDLVAALQPTQSLWLAFAVALVFQFNIILIVCIWGAGLHLSATVAQLFLIVPAVYMMEILPITISGVGLREGTYAVLFATFGLPAEQGVALGVLTSVMRYLVGAVGSLAWFIPDPADPVAPPAAKATRA